MENISKQPQEAAQALTIPAQMQDITLMSEFHELREVAGKIRLCLQRVDSCASSRDIDAEVNFTARELEKGFDAASERLEKLAQMPGFKGRQADVQRQRFLDMDFFLANPELVLTRHRNMALAAMAAAQARVQAAWGMSAVTSRSMLERLRQTVNLLQPQLDHLMGRLANRRRELAEQYPHLASELSRIELDGVNDTTSKWLLKGPRSV